ncbi:MAG: tetrahydromethanopterin S-methyltransferase subunit A [Candidatus Hecatellaceae archaeon]|nr:MAG: tetrahydromethanopterin S-methyltransferase subunit A [Candidatus Hecatellales archaeon]
MAQNNEKGEEKSAAKKVEVSEWPVVSGDYVVGDPKGSVVVVTLASAALVKELVKQPGVALVGECKTENVGIEKVVLNTISNPNIRFLIVCGTEVAGHVTGGTFKAFAEHGIDLESKRVRQAPGAIPYLEALPEEAVERFRKQVQFVDMINVEDVGQITAKIKELAAQDPGAYPEPPLVIKIAEAAEAEAEAFRIPLMVSLPPTLKVTEKLLDDIEFKVQLISRERRLTVGVENTRLMGTLLGFLSAIGVLALILALGA